MTTPIGGSGGTAPPIGGAAPMGGTVDTIASSPYVVEGRVSIQEYARTVINTIDEFVQQLYEAEASGFLTSRDTFLHISQAAGLLRQQLAVFDEHSEISETVFLSLNDAIINQNSEIALFNTGVASTSPGDVTEESEIATLNQAIEDYNNGVITGAQLQDAVDAYESYRAVRNLEVESYNDGVTAYNLIVLDLNISIVSINDERTSLNEQYGLDLPLIPIQDFLTPREELVAGPNVPFTIPVDTLASTATVPLLQEIPEPPPVDLINADIDTINATIGTYNLGVFSTEPLDITEASVIDDLNDAISRHNNGLISSSELQDAIDAYNSYKSGRDSEIAALNVEIAAFIDAIPAYNLAIDAINAERESYGLLPIEYIPEASRFPSQQEIDDGATVPELLTLRNEMPVAPTSPFSMSIELLQSPSTQNTVDLISSQSISGLFNDLVIAPLIENALPFITALSDILIDNDRYLRFLTYILPGKRFVLPESVDQKKHEFRSEGSPPRGGYGTLALGLSSPNVERVLSKALFEAIPRGFDVSGLGPFLQLSLFFTFQLLQRAGLAAAIPAIAILSRDLPTLETLPFREVNDTSLNIVLAGSFASQIRNIVTSGVVEESITSLIAQEPTFQGLTGENRSLLIDAVSGAIGFNLLSVGLQAVSRALRTPGLAPQLFSQLPVLQGLPEDTQRLIQSFLAPPSFVELLDDSFLSSALVNILVNGLLDAAGALSAGRTGQIAVTGLVAFYQEIVSKALGQSGPAGVLLSLEQQLSALGNGPLDQAFGVAAVLGLIRGSGASPETNAAAARVLSPLLGPLPQNEAGRQQLFDSIFSQLTTLGLSEPLLSQIKGVLTPLGSPGMLSGRGEAISLLGLPAAAGGFGRVPFYHDIALRAVLYIYDHIPLPPFSQSELAQPLFPGAIGSQELQAALDSLGIGNSASIADDVIARTTLANSLLNDQQVREGIVRGLLTRDLVLRDLIARDAVIGDIIRRDLALRDLRYGLIRRLAQETDLSSAAVQADQAIAALRNDAVLNERLQVALIDQGVLRDSLTKSFIERGVIERDAVAKADLTFRLLAADRRSFENEQAFRNSVKSILVNEIGLSNQAAANIAGSINIGLPDLTSAALLNQGVVDPLTSAELEGLLGAAIDTALIDKIDREQADQVRQDILASLIKDDLSYRNLISDQVKRIGKLHDLEYFENVGKLFRSSTHLSVDLNEFLSKVQDPAYALIFSAWGGLMYNDSQPTNYKRDIDIQV